MKPKHFARRSRICLTILAAFSLAAGAPAVADETSCSPYTPLIKGQEDLVYVWTLGVKGVGELGTIGATPSVVNAVADALARAGHGAQAPGLQMPLTAARVWGLLNAR